mmetsp:Transcript_32242/g.41436  ORF Transcript_32242/g.41436 Transcript_32242/m.41436 type:complete len:156 (-) Transcript_32242:113-580(-)
MAAARVPHHVDDSPTKSIMSRAEVDIGHQRYPYSVVWGPLGPLTCCMPCVGHMGIGDSQGRIHDFNGPYSIGIDRFMVGTVWRYAVFKDAENDPKAWDEAVSKSDEEYRGKMHNICCQNCHHHTADALTYSGRPNGLLSSWLFCFLHGHCTWCSK